MSKHDPLLSTTFRALRKATDLSQVKFAALIGCSASAVESIECGRLAVSVELANRIAAFTGINPASLLKPTGIPVALDGQEYTVESWKMWQEMGCGEDEFVGILTRASLAIQLMLNATRENSVGTKQTPAKFRAFVFRLSQWMEEMREEFGVEEATQTLLREATTRSESTPTTVGQMRAGFADSGPLKSRVNAGLQDGDSATVTVTVYQLWTPLCGFVALQRGDEKALGFQTSGIVWRSEVYAQVGSDRFLIERGEKGCVRGIIGADALPAPAPAAPAAPTKSKPARKRKAKE